MRIGEAAAAAGMTTKTLRFYEDSGLLPAAKRSSNGYRDYHDDSVARLVRSRRSSTISVSSTIGSWPNWTTRFLN